VIRDAIVGLHNSYDPTPSLQMVTDTTLKNKRWVRPT